MPRSGAMSQADRRGRKSSVQLSPPPMQDQEAQDIIPGRLTQAQWNNMLIQEEADETVGEIMKELMSMVMDGCLMVYVKRQLAPFSASWAKSYLTQILEQQFLCLDEGEGPEEAFNTEDSEPIPTTSDAWLQGCVPIKHAVPQHKSTSQQDVCISQVPEQIEPTSDQHVVPLSSYSPKQCEKETSPRRPGRQKLNNVLSPHPSPKVDRNQKQQTRSLPRSVRGKLLPRLSCSSERQDVEVKRVNRTFSVSNHLTRSLNHLKDHQPIPRLEPSNFPRHCIIPQYEILDNANTKSSSKKQSRLYKLEQTSYKEQQPESTVTSLRLLTSTKDQSGEFQRRNEADLCLRKPSPSGHSKDGMLLSGSLRLDMMEFTKGVSLLDPQADVINSVKFTLPALSTKLRPIQHEATVPLYSIEQVATARPSKVSPVFQSKN